MASGDDVVDDDENVENDADDVGGIRAVARPSLPLQLAAPVEARDAGHLATKPSTVIGSDERASREGAKEETEMGLDCSPSQRKGDSSVKKKKSRKSVFFPTCIFFSLSLYVYHHASFPRTCIFPPKVSSADELRPAAGAADRRGGCRTGSRCCCCCLGGSLDEEALFFFGGAGARGRAAAAAAAAADQGLAAEAALRQRCCCCCCCQCCCRG